MLSGKAPSLWNPDVATPQRKPFGNLTVAGAGTDAVAGADMGAGADVGASAGRVGAAAVAGDAPGVSTSTTARQMDPMRRAGPATPADRRADRAKWAEGAGLAGLPNTGLLPRNGTCVSFGLQAARTGPSTPQQPNRAISPVRNRAVAAVAGAARPTHLPIRDIRHK
ncbi:hypothetical protein GCM10009736_70350 [Actinomadura bangladeshensis]